MDKCQICQKDFIPVDKFTLRICKHIFCHLCLCNYIVANISINIKCPLSSCKKYIPDQIIRQCLSNQLILVYERLSLPTSNIVKCLTTDCPFVISANSSNVIFYCSVCEQPNCMKCKRRHHANNPCGNSNEDTIEQAAIEALSKYRRNELVMEYNQKSFVPNSDSFSCPICTAFVLPRNGMITRNCHHLFCKPCFKTTMETVGHIDQLECPICNTTVDGRDLIETLGINKLMLLNLKKAATKCFTCQFPDCIGICDSNQQTGIFDCPVCRHKSCLQCKDIHEKMSCDQFKQSPAYKNMQLSREKLKNEKSITCICGKTLIFGRGCGALYCDNCTRHICVFTGKLAGKIGPEGCGCQSTEKCHPDCENGCLPERI